MDLDERISKLKEEINIVPDEKDIRKTIEASRAGFIREEEKWTLPYHLFLYDQFRLIRKRWWMLQILCLLRCGQFFRQQRIFFTVCAVSGSALRCLSS